MNNDSLKRILAMAIRDMNMFMARKLIIGNNVVSQNLDIDNKRMFYFIRKTALLNDRPLLRELLRYNSELGGKVLWTVLNNIEVAKTMVEAGAALNVGKEDAKMDYETPDWFENMPPVGLINQGPNNAVLEFMEQYHALWGQAIHPQGYKSNQSTFLHVLVASNDPAKLELADLMIHHNANVNALDENGDSVLKCAIEAGVSKEFIVKLLCNNVHYFGRDVVTIVDCDRTADLIPLIITTQGSLELSRRHRVHHAIVCLVNSHPEKVDAIEALFQYDVPVDMLDYRGDTLLHNAILKVEPKLVEFLLKNNADPNRSTSQRFQPLWITSTLKESVMSSLLIKYGADVNRPNKRNGQHPIHGACKSGSLNNIFLLTRLGADIDIADMKGLTPLSILFSRLSSNINLGFTVEGKFIVRQFALAAIRGIEFDARYMRFIKSSLRLHELFVLSFNELEQMQRIEAGHGIPYYTFLTGSTERTSWFTRRDDVTNVFENLTMLRELFPCFFYDLRNTYVFAKERENQLLYDEIIFEKFQIVLPDLVIHKINGYLGKIDFYSHKLSDIIWE